MTDLSDHVIPRPEGDLHVHLAGDAGPPVLLLSGAGLDNALLSWRDLIPDLARDHRVVAPDWPKQGRSRPWHGRAPHEVLLRTVVDVLDDLGIERIAVVGLSQGGALALATAIEHPERVERVVALAPAGTLSFPPGLHQLLWLTARVPLLSRTLPNLAFRSRAAVTAFARRALFGDAGRVPDLDEIVDAVLAEARSGNAGSSDWQNGSIGFRRMRVDLRPPALGDPLPRAVRAGRPGRRRPRGDHARGRRRRARRPVRAAARAGPLVEPGVPGRGERPGQGLPGRLALARPRISRSASASVRPSSDACTACSTSAVSPAKYAAACGVTGQTCSVSGLHAQSGFSPTAQRWISARVISAAGRASRAPPLRPLVDSTRPAAPSGTSSLRTRLGFVPRASASRPELTVEPSPSAAAAR